MLGTRRRVRVSKTKNVNPATKMDANSSRLMCGFIQQRRVRCGKANCKCAHGETHTAFYHVWYADGERYQKYVRRADVDELLAACLNYRNLQIQIRAGRAERKQLFARVRALLRLGIL